MEKLSISSEDVGTGDEPVVKLEVGGVLYTLPRAKITAHPDTMLGTMFSARNKALVGTAADGIHKFPDRNGKVFFLIHQYYQTDGNLPTAMLDILTGPTRFDPEELKAEFDFFQVPFSSSKLWSSAYFAPYLRMDAFVRSIGLLIHNAIISCHDFAAVKVHSDGMIKASLGDSQFTYHESNLFPAMNPKDVKWLYRVFVDPRFKKLQARFTNMMGKELAPSSDFQWAFQLGFGVVSIHMSNIIDYNML
ncbi:hypothetical protein BC938DRAFT_478282 [Jimgerdemannia flammicorona]|uniref:Potassium channel tetramerisation-type BTB domain-containing protein n=1 Tax=Jimgerdemannia flammicorona TaxID=994334 RepID=A0A433QN25_9FUNG|nr:hypothetical protein BC938DRAFT_478282 [Jimgerdemannia flammicorona]